MDLFKLIGSGISNIRIRTSFTRILEFFLDDECSDKRHSDPYYS